MGARRLGLAVAAAFGSGCTGADPVPPPCAGGTWGAIDDPAAAVHVRADGDDGSGDGTPAAPFATVSAARAAGGGAAIAVGPGEFSAALALGEADGGFVLQGCGAGETTLVEDAAGQPIVSFSGTVDAEVAGITLADADRPLFVSGGAQVRAIGVEIAGGRWSGFVVDGPYTILELEDVAVTGTSAVGGVGGYGGEVDGGTLRWTGGASVGNVGAALVAAGSTAVLDLDGVRIADTAPADDGRFGRGVQLQDYATATLRGCTVADNHDAGVFALLATNLVVDGLTVERTAAGPVGGDGIVVTGVDADGRQLDPALFRATLTGNTVTDPGRAGIVVERITATLDGNTVTGAAADPIVAQAGAVVSGGDAVQVPAEPLALERAPIDGVGGP